MKRITALVCAALLVCMCLSACSSVKEPDAFVPIDTEKVATSAWSAENEETGAEKGKAVAEIYNTLAVFGGADEGAKVSWTFTIIASGDVPSIYELAYVGGNTFNVKVSSGDKVSKYQVESAELLGAIEAE